MNRWIDGACRGIETVIAAMLAVMVVLVFGNVVLRYGFNSGITVSEEVSRWLFVWMTFLGGIVAVHEHGHLGTDMLVSRLPVAGRKACLIAVHLLMLYACWLLLTGSWAQALINREVAAPTTGASVAIFYASGVVFGVSAIAMLLHGLWRIVSGQLAEHELVQVHESEEQGDIDRITAELARRDAEEAAAAATARNRGQ